MSTYEERLHIAKESIKEMRAAIKDVHSHVGMEVKVYWNGRVKVDGEVFWEYEMDGAHTKHERKT